MPKQAAGAKYSETISFRARAGTKEGLRKMAAKDDDNVTDVLRDAIDKMLSSRA